MKEKVMKEESKHDQHPSFIQVFIHFFPSPSIAFFPPLSLSLHLSHPMILILNSTFSLPLLTRSHSCCCSRVKILLRSKNWKRLPRKTVLEPEKDERRKVQWKNQDNRCYGKTRQTERVEIQVSFLLLAPALTMMTFQGERSNERMRGKKRRNEKVWKERRNKNVKNENELQKRGRKREL